MGLSSDATRPAVMKPGGRVRERPLRDRLAVSNPRSSTRRSQRSTEHVVTPPGPGGVVGDEMTSSPGQESHRVHGTANAERVTTRLRMWAFGGSCVSRSGGNHSRLKGMTGAVARTGPKVPKRVATHQHVWRRTMGHDGTDFGKVIPPDACRHHQRKTKG